eukprot:CCRYP_007981-RA/>CCRYP_007981-RA protein AED:0.00 eAED:0.00 QI:697/-1/1/1/-1/1/1/108/812
MQLTSATGASRTIGHRRLAIPRHIHINPFSTISRKQFTSPNRISSISSYEKAHAPFVSIVRRDVSLVNLARETENGDNDGELETMKSFNRDVNMRDDEDAQDNTNDDSNGEYDNYQQKDPICRVVATSDGKIPAIPAYSSLSPASKTLVQRLELLYTAQSQKTLRDLAYYSPSLSDKHAQHEVDEQTQNDQFISVLKKALEDGGFRLMVQRDFDLCSSLNAGYLLRLSLLPDLKHLDPTIGQEFYPELFNTCHENVAMNKNGKTNNDFLFDGRVLVFRRGYSQEVTTGRLLLPKLDYLQASLVQRSSALLTRKLGVLEQKVEDFIAVVFHTISNTVRRWLRQLLCLIQGTLPDILTIAPLENKFLRNSLFQKGKLMYHQNDTEASGQPGMESNLITSDRSSSLKAFRIRGNKIFKLGRYSVGESHSTFNFLANSLDINDALSSFLLCEVGNNCTSSVEQDMYEGIDTGNLRCQYDETFSSVEQNRRSNTAVRLLERVSIQNTVDFFSKSGRRGLVANFFKKSTLKEPSYEEVVVLWRPLQREKTMKKQWSQFTSLPDWLYAMARIFDMDHNLPKRVKKVPSDEDVREAFTPIEIRAFCDVPMANILAVLPKTKLVFRPADAFVFDVVSLVSFLALGASLKFDNPRLDLLALVSLSLFAIRTFFRYSNKYARYDLLVNKFLTKKLSHRGHGALNYIVSQANSQKALRLGLMRDWLDENNISICEERTENCQTRLNLSNNTFELGKLYANSKASTDAARVDFDVLSAIQDLLSLGLLDVMDEGDSPDFPSVLKVKNEQLSLSSIQKLWNDLLTD